MRSEANQLQQLSGQYSGSDISIEPWSIRTDSSKWAYHTLVTQLTVPLELKDIPPNWQGHFFHGFQGLRPIERLSERAST